MGFLVIAYVFLCLIVCLISAMIGKTVFFVVASVCTIGLIWCVREWIFFRRN